MNTLRLRYFSFLYYFMVNGLVLRLWDYAEEHVTQIKTAYT